MMTSIDGRIVVNNWPLPSAVGNVYEEIHEDYGPDGWLCGRVTMAEFAGGMLPPHRKGSLYAGPARADFRAPGSKAPFAFAVDANGRLDWKGNDIDGDHIVAILGHHVPEAYLTRLRKRGISYILSGDHATNLPSALQKIAQQYAVKTLMLEGGGGINGSFLQANLIDEVSLLVAPVADASKGTAALFDVEPGSMAAKGLALQSIEEKRGLIWARYKVPR